MSANEAKTGRHQAEVESCRLTHPAAEHELDTRAREVLCGILGNLAVKCAQDVVMRVNQLHTDFPLQATPN